MTLTNRYSLIVAACATSLALPLGASAQEAIDEIIVTVQKREQVLSEVPLSAQAFDTAQIEAAGLRNLNDVVNFIPGASVGRTTNAGTLTYQIRGVSSYFGESTVGYYLDDATFSIPNRNFAPIGRTFDVERIEVARGPQGTLYGWARWVVRSVSSPRIPTCRTSARGAMSATQTRMAVNPTITAIWP